MSEDILFQLTWQLLLILVVGFVTGAICKRLGLSMLIGYLVGGVLLGDSMLGQITHGRANLSSDVFESLTHLGALLLLFSIGLEFSLDQLKRMRGYFLFGGVAQMTLVAVPVTLIARYAIDDWRSATLIGLTVAISSTVLVFKALEDYGQIVTRHGRRAIGILLFQDVAIVPLLLLVPMLTGGEPSGAAACEMSGGLHVMYPWLLLAGKSIVFILGVWFLRRCVEVRGVPLLSGMRSVELLVMGTLAILVGVCFLAVSLDLPAAIGALAAGIILGGNRMRHQIEAVILPFRESFATIFFVGLGAMLNLRVLLDHPLISMAILAAVVTIKAGAAALVLRLLRLSWKASIGMGLGLSQMGELSFMLLTQGASFGVLSTQVYEYLLFAAIGSMILTPLLLKVGLRLARGIAEEPAPKGTKTVHVDHPSQPKAFVIGLGPIGARSMSYLEIQGMDVCLLDLSPINLHAFAQQGFRTVAGDATDPDVLERADVAESSCGVISVPDDRVAMQIVRRARQLNDRAIILVRCRYEANVEKIKKSGANVVVSEEREAGGAIIRTLAEFHQAKGTRLN